MTLSHQGLVLLGCGGHARAVADVALSMGYDRLWFVDAAAREGEVFLGRHPVRTDFPSGEDWGYIPASGDNATRLAQIADLRRRSLPVVSVCSGSATLGAGAVLGAGCFVGHHAHIGPLAQIGEGCIINTGAIVEHDCKVGEGTHIAVGATLAGSASLGQRCFIGAGSVVIDGCALGDFVCLGAGAVVVAPILAPGTYVGVPARQLQPRD